MKFCGMCGAPLGVASASEATDAGPSRMPPQESGPTEFEAPPLPVPPRSVPAPAHTGGTFRLGGHDPEPAPRSLDYLLEDDEEAESGHGGWVLGILLALALAGGLGYWHYRNGGWSGAKPAAPASEDASATAGSSPGASPSPSDHPASSTSGSTAGSNSPNPNAGATGVSPEGVPTAALTDVRPKNPVEALPNTIAPAKPDVLVTAPTTRAPKATDLEHDARPVPIKPSAAARPQAPVKAEDPVTLGEKYIYGRGLPQNCERGLKMVKPAADQSNGKAMITMGALYATGHCVTRDLPTAYRYFALALRKDPENAALKQNAEMVWSQMTQSERQQAIRLTQ